MVLSSTLAPVMHAAFMSVELPPHQIAFQVRGTLDTSLLGDMVHVRVHYVEEVPGR
jgi:hypothetical protein